MPNRFGDDLTRLQDINLLQESDSAKHLLAYGIRALRTAAFIETTRDPIMTMLSIGIEKVLKLGLGLLTVKPRVCGFQLASSRTNFGTTSLKWEVSCVKRSAITEHG